VVAVASGVVADIVVRCQIRDAGGVHCWHGRFTETWGASVRLVSGVAGRCRVYPKRRGPKLYCKEQSNKKKLLLEVCG
jgi:hypothetical protein